MMRFCLILPLVLAFVCGMVQCSSDAQPAPIDLPMEQFQAGDIVFRRGESMASRMVLYNDPEGHYSHVGMIVQDDSALMVVHALPGSHPTQSGEDLVRMETLGEFFAPENATRGKVMRLPLSELQKRELSRRAVEKVKTFVAFDHNYDCQDTVEIYCTELLQLLYSHVGINLSEGRQTRISIPGLHADIIMPADIHKNQQLQTIFSY